MTTIRHHRRNILLSFIYIPAGIIFIVLMSIIVAKFWPWGADFYYYYYPLAEKWLNGYHDIYDPNISRLFYPPWSLFIIVPLGFFPIQTAHGFLLTISFVLILLSIRLLKGSRDYPVYFLLLSLINFHSFDLYIRGQLDAIVLFGIALGYWAIKKRKPIWLSLGFCLMVMKPPLNVLLILWLYMISIKQWSKREIVKSFFLPLVMVVVSSLAVGIDWPIKYIRNMVPAVDYISISIWNMAKVLNFPYWIIGIVALFMVLKFLKESLKIGLTQSTLSLALATAFMFTVYANGDHYVLLIPAFLYNMQKSLKLGLLAYAATFTPLLRLVWGPGASSIDILYPAILLIGSLYFIKVENEENKPSIASTANLLTK